uniref:Uncharacterized protein n=1 Tax=Knipowitschia caucasica TaxID=637954 RepID=A0AAV2KJF5_KNICA
MRTTAVQGRGRGADQCRDAEEEQTSAGTRRRSRPQAARRRTPGTRRVASDGLLQNEDKNGEEKLVALGSTVAVQIH